MLASAPAAVAGELELTGQVSGELRLFPQTPKFPGQFRVIQPSVAIEPEFLWQSEDRNHQVSCIQTNIERSRVCHSGHHRHCCFK